MSDEERPYAARHIRHVIPVDGVEHDLFDCVCHPTIHADADVMATGLDELGVKPSEEGALTFVHNKLAETSRYSFVDEEAEWEDES